MIDGHGPIGDDRACKVHDTRPDRRYSRAIGGGDIDPPVSCPPPDWCEASNHGRGRRKAEPWTLDSADRGQDDEYGKQ